MSFGNTMSFVDILVNAKIFLHRFLICKHVGIALISHSFFCPPIPNCLLQFSEEKKIY